MSAATPSSARSRQIGLRQHYSRWQSFRAGMYGRLPLIFESLIALALIVLILFVDIFFFLHHGATDIGGALIATLSLLALQTPNIGHNDQGGIVLLVVNVLFSILFAQSILNSLRVLFRKRSVAVQQLGLASTLRDHIIVCGLGRLQIRVTARLVAAGYAVVVLNRGEETSLLRRALAMRVPVVVGDATDPQALQQAGIMRARAVLAIIDGDLVDVEIALAVRSIRPDIRVILRAFNEDFDRGLEHVFGPNTAFSSSALAAPTFAVAAITRNVEQVLQLDDALLMVIPVDVPAQWQGVRALEESYGVRVLAQTSGKTTKRVFLLCTLAAFTALRNQHAIPEGEMEAIPLAVEPARDRVIICGLGKIGYRVVKLLHAMEPRPHIVVVHPNDGERSFSDEINELGDIEVILGDAREERILRQAGIDRAITVAALTSDDEINVQVGLTARRLDGQIHVVLRVFQKHLAEKLVELFGIHTAFSMTDIASATLASAGILAGITRAFYVNDQLYAVTEVVAQPNGPLVGRSVDDLCDRYHVQVLGITHAGQRTSLPTYATMVAAQDVVLVTAPIEVLAIFRQKIIGI